MKVGPAPPPPDPARLAAPPTAPSRPFADFLAQPSARAAGFSELGMFGRNQAQAEPTPGAAREPPPPAAPPRPIPDLPAPVGEIPWLGAGESPAPSAALPFTEPVTCALPRPAPVKAEPGQICSLPGETAGSPPAAEDPAPTEALPRAARLRLRQAALKAGVNIVVYEHDGAVQIVAGGPPLDAQSRAHLRRLAETLLAPRGLRLAQFQLNGAPLAPDSLGRTGGTNGTRTR